MAETDLQTKFLNYVKKEYPGYWVKLSDKWMSGILDILGCYQGKFIFIELKDKGCKPTDLQDYTMQQVINKGNGISFWGDNLDSLKKQLEFYLGKGVSSNKGDKHDKK